VTELAFLSLDAASEGTLARSPMQRRLHEAGAQFEERDGWLVAVRVPGEERRRLAIRDVTHVLSRHDLGTVPGTVPVTGRDGDERPAGAAPGPTDVRAGHALGTVPGTVPPPAGLAALDIEGPGATTLLRRLTEFDLEALPAVGALAHIRVWVFSRGEESYRLVFDQEYGHYLWEVVVDAAGPLGGGPVGTP
jgi:glycine cleavage system aminomethyltransferase T